MGERRRTTALAIGLLALVGGTTVVAGTAGAEDPLSPPQATTPPVMSVITGDAPGPVTTVGSPTTTAPVPASTVPGTSVPDSATTPGSVPSSVGEVPTTTTTTPTPTPTTTTPTTALPATARSARPVVFDAALLGDDPNGHADGRLAPVEVSLTERPVVVVPVTSVPAGPVPIGPSDEALAELRRCEASGDYGAVSWGGTYRGAYQFDQRTWDSVASRWLPRLVGADPAGAAPADQDLLARALYDERGWAPWPTCGWGL